MTRAFRFKKFFFHQRLVVGVLVGWLMLIWPGLTQANGGTILLVEQVGAYDFTVTGSPYPLQVGVNDISVLLGRLSDAQIVLDAEVTLTVEPIDRPDESQIFAATHDNATNKLYYAANVVFPTPGRWQLTVQVDGPEGSASTTFEAQVEEKSPLDFLRYVSLVGLPLVVIVLLFFVMSRWAGKAIKDDLEGET